MCWVRIFDGLDSARGIAVEGILRVELFSHQHNPRVGLTIEE